MTDARRVPNPSPYFLWGELCSDLTIDSELKKRSFFNTQCCHTDLLVHCGSHFIIFITHNFSLFIIPWKKNKLCLPVGLSVCPFNCPLGCLSLGCIWPLLIRSNLPAWPPRESFYLSELQSGGPPWLSWLSLVFFVHCSHSLAPSVWWLWEPSYLSYSSLVVPLDLPLSLLMQSSLPAWQSWEYLL